MVDNREDIVGRTWLIRKDGYFYRPNKSGYTTSKAEAGRYNEADAKRECEIEPWHMKAIHESEWPDDPVSKDINDKVARLTVENQALRARLETVEAALNCALNVWAPLEPGDSRAVSDEFVAVASVASGHDNPQCHEIIAAANARNLEPRHD